MDPVGSGQVSAAEKQRGQLKPRRRKPHLLPPTLPHSAPLCSLAAPSKGGPSPFPVPEGRFDILGKFGVYIIYIYIYIYIQAPREELAPPFPSLFSSFSRIQSLTPTHTSLGPSPIQLHFQYKPKSSKSNTIKLPIQTQVLQVQYKPKSSKPNTSPIQYSTPSNTIQTPIPSVQQTPVLFCSVLSCSFPTRPDQTRPDQTRSDEGKRPN